MKKRGVLRIFVVIFALFLSAFGLIFLGIFFDKLISYIIVNQPTVEPQINSPSYATSTPDAKALEQQLKEVNILLCCAEQSEQKGATRLNEVRHFLQTAATYQTLASSCLTVLSGKKLLKPVDLDVIRDRYAKMIDPNAKDLPAEQYSLSSNPDHAKKLKAAILKHWNEIYPEHPETEFDKITITK